MRRLETPHEMGNRLFRCRGPAAVGPQPGARENDRMMPPEKQPHSAFSSLLGFVVEDAGEGYATMSCGWQPAFENMSGVAHGGVAAALMDTACGVALTTDADGVRQGRALTVSFTLSYLGAFREGTVRCEARVVGGGRKLQTVEARVIGSDGSTVIALGHGVFRRIG